MSLWLDLAGCEYRIAYINAGGLRTRYLEAGREGRENSKEALVFLHGSGGYLEAYTKNIPAHAKHMRVFAIDMIGHGWTDKPDHPYEPKHYVKHLLDFCDAMGLECVHLSGESLGGWVASHFAVTHPSRVTKLVLNTAGGDRIDMEALGRIRAMTMAAVEDPSWERLKGRLEFLMSDKTLVHDDLIAGRQRIYAAPGMTTAMAHVLSMHTPEARQKYALTTEQWASIKQPTLVLWTSHDPTAKVEVGEKLASLIPGAKLVVMQDCGHWPQFEDAPTFNRIHLEFLKSGTS